MRVDHATAQRTREGRANAHASPLAPLALVLRQERTGAMERLERLLRQLDPSLALAPAPAAPEIRPNAAAAGTPAPSPPALPATVGWWSTCA